jgi:hypothetical protein
MPLPLNQAVPADDWMSEGAASRATTETGDGDWFAAMRAGEFARAWAINDADLCADMPGKHEGPRHLQRIWRGEPLAGRRVLVRCYHGLGDTIQFIRFARPLRAVASEVTVWCQPELVDLVRRAPGVDRVLPLHDGSPEASFDVDIEVMELAHALRVASGALAAHVPYLFAADRQRLARRLPRKDGLSVGLVWAAGAWDTRRSIPPALLKPLAAIPGIRLYSLQGGAQRDGAALIPARDVGVADLASLAALIGKLDLVVSVDTMVAHLAGALGGRAWTLLHADCDWRWQRGPRSFWYPTMRLFHQRTAGDWRQVIDEVANALAVLGRSGASREGNLPGVSGRQSQSIP